MKDYTTTDLVNLDTNNYEKRGNYNPFFVTEADYKNSKTNIILQKLIEKATTPLSFNWLDLTSGSRYFSKNIVSKFSKNIKKFFLNDLHDFYKDNKEYSNIFNYNILEDKFSSIIEQNSDNFIVFLNPYISTKNTDYYAIQGSKLKESKIFKEELKKCLDLLKEKSFIFIFNSTKTDVYLDIIKELFECKEITPDVLKKNKISLYGKEDGYIFLTNITQGQYETTENIAKNKSLQKIDKRNVNLLVNRESFYSIINEISQNK